MTSTYLLIGVVAALFSTALCYRGTYRRSSSGSGGEASAIVGYVFLGIGALTSIGFLIYCLVRHCNKKKMGVQPQGYPPRNMAKGHHGPMGAPPPYPGGPATYNNPPGAMQGFNNQPQPSMQGFSQQYATWNPSQAHGPGADVTKRY